MRQKNDGQTIWIWRPQCLNEKLGKKLAVEQAYTKNTTCSSSEMNSSNVHLFPHCTRSTAVCPQNPI